MSTRKAKWGTYIFVIEAVASFAFGVGLIVTFFIGPTWDVYTDKGNIMYHEPVCFAYALIAFALGGICLARFDYWRKLEASR